MAPERWLPFAFDWNLGDQDEQGNELGQILTSETPGWHPAKQERLIALVQRRYTELHRALVEDGGFNPFIMQPLDENDQPLTGTAAISAALAPWVIGFTHALNHFPALEALPSTDLPDLLACLMRHLPDQSEDEQAYTKALDQEHPLKSLDAAIEDLVHNVVEIADIARADLLKVETVRRTEPKVGRNDPCPCGSGRKFKQCHGKDDAV